MSVPKKIYSLDNREVGLKREDSLKLRKKNRESGGRRLSLLRIARGVSFLIYGDYPFPRLWLYTAHKR